MIYLLSQYCQLDKSAGYLERSLYLYQCIIERGLAFMLLPPLKDIDKQYEEYCELEYPRIGEML